MVIGTFNISAPKPKAKVIKTRDGTDVAARYVVYKLYEATGGPPQRWESLGNLCAVKADAAGIAYAVERDWLIISGGLHSVSLTEAGRRWMK
jgi:hypothetical protein